MGEGERKRGVATEGGLGARLGVSPHKPKLAASLFFVRTRVTLRSPPPPHPPTLAQARRRHVAGVRGNRHVHHARHWQTPQHREAPQAREHDTKTIRWRFSRSLSGGLLVFLFFVQCPRGRCEFRRAASSTPARCFWRAAGGGRSRGTPVCPFSSPREITRTPASGWTGYARGTNERTRGRAAAWYRYTGRGVK